MREEVPFPGLESVVGLRDNHIRGHELGQGFILSHMRGCVWGHASSRIREHELWQLGGQEARWVRGVVKLGSP